MFGAFDVPSSLIRDRDVCRVRKFNDDLFVLYYLKSVRRSGWISSADDLNKFNSDNHKRLSGYYELLNPFTGDLIKNQVLDFETMSPVGSKYKSDDMKKVRLSQSLSRSRRNIFELVMCNDFKYFFTGTFDENKIDRFDLSEIRKVFTKWLNNYKTRKAPDFKYLMIVEEHKKGGYHLHGCLSGIPENDLALNEYGYFDWLPYVKRFGYMSLSEINDKSATAKYITKYVTKQLGNCLEAGRSTVWHSLGLKRAEFVELDYFNPYTVAWDFENDFCKITEFHSESELMEQLKNSYAFTSMCGASK